MRHDANEIANMFGGQAPEAHGQPEKVLLRVFVHFYGTKVTLLLGGYDKGESPKERRQRGRLHHVVHIGSLALRRLSHTGCVGRRRRVSCRQLVGPSRHRRVETVVRTVALEGTDRVHGAVARCGRFDAIP